MISHSSEVVGWPVGGQATPQETWKTMFLKAITDSRNLHIQNYLYLREFSYENLSPDLNENLIINAPTLMDLLGNINFVKNKTYATFERNNQSIKIMESA